MMAEFVGQGWRFGFEMAVGVEAGFDFESRARVTL